MLTAKQVSDILSVSPRHVLNLVRLQSGPPATNIAMAGRRTKLRFRKEDLLEWINRRRFTPDPDAGYKDKPDPPERY